MNIDTLFEKAKKCKLCYKNISIYVPLPDPKNGKKDVSIMFVNERPGRVGTGDSGYVSFDNDDPSANLFKECFFQLGISRKKIFITNACICHPKFEGYKDKAPSTEEIRNCGFWLKRQISITQPKLIVTLGNNALKSIRYIFPESKQLKNFRLKHNIGEIIKETKPWIYPLYHTSIRARRTRNVQQQKKDWLNIKKISG
ncbi:MAG: hypothetical protein GOU97_04600 [Nanoarchaeota archaeon]|nr:hypothetical protein [Nanoarchaeota archaeon]